MADEKNGAKAPPPRGLRVATHFLFHEQLLRYPGHYFFKYHSFNHFFPENAPLQQSAQSVAIVGLSTIA